MLLIIYFFLCTIIIFFLSKFSKKNNFFLNQTGEIHQTFTSSLKIPLLGGLLIFLCILPLFWLSNIKILIFLSLILSLGIFSDLKLLKSVNKRFFLQVVIILGFVLIYELKILDTRVPLLDALLNFSIFNIFFVTFCILIVINGSNFLDGLNTLLIGYYSIIIFTINILILNKDIIFINFEFLNHLLIILFLLYLLNFFNILFLGDSGSYILGFIFSILLIDLYLLNIHISPFFIILLLWYPCYENLFSIIRKIVFNRSSVKPDSNHLHQLIFNYIKKKTNFSHIKSNLISANLINFYNLIIFIFSINFVSNTKIMVIFILFNLLVYTVLYIFLFRLRFKRSL